MKQFTPIKILIFSALFLANFSFFAMEKDSKGEKQEILDQKLNDFITSSKAREIKIDNPYYYYNKQLMKLLEGGANPTGKIPTRSGYYTPLETVLYLNFFPPKFVKRLLEYTTTDQLNSSRPRALYDLIRISSNRTAEDKLEIIDLYKKKGFVFKGKELLCTLCSSVSSGERSNFKVAKKLIEDCGVRVDETSEPFGTPMHCLATNGRDRNSDYFKELLNEIRLTRDLLLKNGASLDAKNNKDFTPYGITLDRTGYYYGKKLKEDSLISKYNEEFKAIFNPKQQ